MICKTCNIEKDTSEFYYRLDTNKYRTSCKKCTKLHIKQYRDNNYDKVVESKKNIIMKIKINAVKEVEIGIIKIKIQEINLILFILKIDVKMMLNLKFILIFRTESTQH